MKSLLLMTAIVFSSQLAARATNPKKIGEAAKFLEGAIRPELVETLTGNKINSIAQVILDQDKPDVSLLLHFTDNNSQIYDMGKAHDGQGNEVTINADAILLEGFMEKEISRLLHSGTGFVINKRLVNVNGGKQKFVFISPYTFEDGEVSFANIRTLHLRRGILAEMKDNSIVNDYFSQFTPATNTLLSLDNVAPAATLEDPTLALNPDIAAKENLTTKDILAKFSADLKLEMTPDVRSLLEAANKGLQELRDTHHTTASKALIAAMADEKLIWPGDSLSWPDFVDYVDGMQSSSTLIETATAEAISALGEALEGKLKQHLGREAVLTAADFKNLCRNSSLCWGYRTKENGLTIEKMLAIERVLAVHDQSVAVNGDDSYLDTMDSPLKQSVRELISVASKIYRGELLQPKEYELPAPKDLNPQKNPLPKHVQEITDMLNNTEHILYTDTFENWLKELKEDFSVSNNVQIDEITLVKERLELWLKLKGKEILRIKAGGEFQQALDGEIKTNPNGVVRKNSVIIADKWPIPENKNGDMVKGHKLRMYYVKYGDKVVLLNGLSGKYNDKPGSKDKQGNTIDTAQEILDDRLPDEIAKSMQAKEEARQEN